MTDSEIIAIRDQHLPSQGEPFDCLAFARAILRERDKLKYPAARCVGRVGDMAPPQKTHMRVMFDSDNDVCVSIWDDEDGRMANAAIEFCTGIGGGKSPHTREALIAVMVAMEVDNAERPSGQYPPARKEPQ